MRIALGLIKHEANSFSPLMTDLDDFETCQLERGDEILVNWRTANTEQAGALSVLLQEYECEVLPLLAARALAGGPVRAKVFSTLLEELMARLQAALPVDGILLVLHGAMMADGLPDATGEILGRVRALVGPKVPVVGTLDLHANVTERMVREATALIGYHTTPHVDQRETGERAARLLLEVVRGQVSPTTTLVRLPLNFTHENCTHMWPPLAELINMALELEKEGTILHGGIYPVQSWLDTEDIASSVVVITDSDPRTAREQADGLAHEFWMQRQHFLPELVPPDEAALQAFARRSGTVIYCDSADSTSSGSTGDSTAILQALLRVAPFEEVALLNVVDPQVVAQAIEAGVGNTVTVEVGGKLAPNFFTPVAFRGYVKTISDGRFRFKGPGMRGVEHRMGRAVVLIQGGIHLVIMERAVSQWDPQLYRSLGEEPSDAHIVQVKSPMAFRAAYKGIADEVLTIAAPGAATPNLGSLPWRHLRRPIYPLDPEMTWPPELVLPP